MQNILIVNVNWLGDVVFSSPIFRALKEKYPQSRVSCLAVPRVKEVLECVEGLDEIIIYDEDGRHKSIFGKLSLIHELRRKKFDVAFLLHRSLTRALLVYWAGIKERIGYDTKGRSKFLTKAIPEPKENIHRSDYYLKVIESYGIEIKNRQCVLKIDPRTQYKIESIMGENKLVDGNFIVIHPGGNWDLKRWPAENYHLLVQKIMKSGSLKIVFTGSAADQDLVGAIINKLSIKPIVFAGKLTLKELMALMQKAKCVISADSGPIHLASGVGTITIGLFGPTRPEITGPRGNGKIKILQKDVGCNRQACYHLKCPSNICMQALTVEDVYSALG